MCTGPIRRTRRCSASCITGKRVAARPAQPRPPSRSARHVTEGTMKKAAMSGGLVATTLVAAFVLGAPRPAQAQDPALAKKGEAVYAAQKCSTCHSIAGKGAKASPLDGVG